MERNVSHYTSPVTVSGTNISVGGIRAFEPSWYPGLHQVTNVVEAEPITHDVQVGRH